MRSWMLWYKSGTGYPISTEHLSTHPDRFMIFCFLKKSFNSEPVSLLVTSRFFSLRCSSISSKQLKPSDGLKCFSLPWPSRLFSDRLQRAQYFSILKHNKILKTLTTRKALCHITWTQLSARSTLKFPLFLPMATDWSKSYVWMALMYWYQKVTNCMQIQINSLK